jgi:hypothetical protein
MSEDEVHEFLAALGLTNPLSSLVTAASKLIAAMSGRGEAPVVQNLL